MRHLEALQALGYFGNLGRHRGQTLSGFTGTMAAALAANSTIFSARMPFTAGSPPASVGLVKWIHLHFCCLVSFTTPITAGRRLSLKRTSSAYNEDPNVGTALDVCLDNPLASGTEALWTGRVAATVALTNPTTPYAYETATRRRLPLAHVGNAGADYDELWEFADPFILPPGYVASIVNPAVFDAVGTWQLHVQMGVVEVPYA
jgi:hypothetical protein